MDSRTTDPTPRLLSLARAAVLAVEKRRSTNDDPRSTRPLADAALEERARVLAEVLGQAERRSAAMADAAGTLAASVQPLGVLSDADELDDRAKSEGQESRTESRIDAAFARALASSSSFHRDDLRRPDGEDGPSDLERIEPWQEQPAKSPTSLEGQ